MSTRPALTDIQLRLARFVAQFMLDARYSPSLSECAAGIGRKESATADHLKRLVKKGVLGHKPGVPRALWVEDAWVDALGARKVA